MNEVRPTRHFGSSFMTTFQFQWAVQTSSLLPTKKLIVSSYHMSIHPQCNASFLLEIKVEEDAQQSNTDQSLIKWMLHYVFRLWSFQEPSYRLASSVSLWRFVYSDLSGNNWLYQPKAKQSMHDHTAQRPLPQLAFWRVYLNNAMVDPDFLMRGMDVSGKFWCCNCPTMHAARVRELSMHITSIVVGSVVLSQSLWLHCTPSYS